MSLKNNNILLSGCLSNNKGSSAIVISLCISLFIGIAAFAIDIGYLCVVRNELQNAADSGALAGARVLYNDTGSEVNTVGYYSELYQRTIDSANQVAHDTAEMNNSAKTAVEVDWSTGNGGDVERGHWNWITREFTPNPSSVAVSLWKSNAELAADLDFINAIRVTARRQTMPITSFFANIFGVSGFEVSAEAIAFRGFAGRFLPGEVDQPIAICEGSIINESGGLSCGMGRMINSGSKIETSETGGWTDFNQDDPCTGGTNASTMNSLICSGGNPDEINVGFPVATNGGEIQSAFNSFVNCWKNASVEIDGVMTPIADPVTGIPIKSWRLTLLVVDCPDNNIGTCQVIKGAVTLDVIWINPNNDPLYYNVPMQMDGWSCGPCGSSDSIADQECRMACWDDFVDFFNLRNVDGTYAPYQQKAIYFKPDCSLQTPKGSSGGEGFGILAERPLLVQ